uniref:Uncharacterized protein n=1 Tax=Myotis myotis TaxID=51298 RepID=A0A7J7Z6N5_MYOMY|nr:hypothetical protein mMyoMyo1_010707 [Myotis myotis]
MTEQGIELRHFHCFWVLSHCYQIGPRKQERTFFFTSKDLEMRCSSPALLYMGGHHRDDCVDAQAVQAHRGAFTGRRGSPGACSLQIPRTPSLSGALKLAPSTTASVRLLLSCTFPPARLLTMTFRLTLHSFLLLNL